MKAFTCMQVGIQTSTLQFVLGTSCVTATCCTGTPSFSWPSWRPNSSAITMAKALRVVTSLTCNSSLQMLQFVAHGDVYCTFCTSEFCQIYLHLPVRMCNMQPDEVCSQTNLAICSLSLFIFALPVCANKNAAQINQHRDQMWLPMKFINFAT